MFRLDKIDVVLLSLTIGLVLIAGSLGSCRRAPVIEDTHQVEEPYVSKVGDRVLLCADLKGVVPAGIDAKDSTAIVQRYVDEWVMLQLKVVESEKTFKELSDDIERLVEEYRNSLLRNKIEKYYVENRLDTVVTDSDIADYYDRNQNDFLLDRTIVKGRIVKLPAKHSQKRNVISIMKSKGSKQDDLMPLCTKNNLLLLEYDSWVDFSEFLANLPVSKLRSYNYLLKNGVSEMADGAFVYIIKVSAYRSAGYPIPIERVEESIKRVIIHRRAQALVTEFEDSLRFAAKINNSVEIKWE